MLKKISLLLIGLSLISVCNASNWECYDDEGTAFIDRETIEIKNSFLYGKNIYYWLKQVNENGTITVMKNVVTCEDKRVYELEGSIFYKDKVKSQFNHSSRGSQPIYPDTIDEAIYKEYCTLK